MLNLLACGYQFTLILRTNSPVVSSISKFIKPLNTRWLLLLSFICITWVNLNYARWKKSDTIHQDVNGYYSYLPAFFYEHDLRLNFLNDSLNSETEKRYYWPNTTPEGHYVVKYTMGMALSYLPFFGAAHLYCKFFGIEANGFTEPYHFAIQFSSMCYALMGLYFLILLLKTRFSNKTIWLVSLGILFGTNLYYYCTGAAGMPHATIFGFFCMFLYYSFKWHQTPIWRYSFMCGLSLGIIVLIRPVHLLFVFVPLLYRIRSLESAKTQVRFFRTHSTHLFFIVFITCFIFLPQLFYWKMLSGQYFFNSYIGEGFYFSNPHVVEGLFSFRKGWLLYTPLMAFALLGFYPLYKKHRDYFCSILCFLPLYLYITFSWWCWWYGGSFGQRSMIDVYPLLALPLAAFIESLATIKPFYRIVSAVLLVFFFLLNLFQNYQAKRNVIHYDSMSARAYCDALFRIEEYPGRDSLLLSPDYENAKKGLDERKTVPLPH
jgi:TRAP-type C4-dicarboxylate transport system permease small subunit